MKNTRRILYKGKPSLSHFSDLFRYRLFEKTDMIWIDCDMLLLKEFGSFKFPAPCWPRSMPRACAARLCGWITITRPYRKAFLPEYADECAELCRNSHTMHLWNNIVVDLGIWKDFMPPKGSFLSNRFCADGSDGYFRDTYPEDVMRSMVQNWRGRFSGADLPLGPLVRRIVPSVNTFVQKKLGDYRLKFAS